MDPILLALTLGPAAAIILFIYMRDKYDKEPLGLLIRCFLFGILSTFGVLVVSPVWDFLGFKISPNIMDTFWFAFVAVALTEEFFKYVFTLRGAYRKDAFDEPYDGIVYAVMVAMGFAAFENVLYVFGALGEGTAYNVAIMRAFTAVPAHATFGVMMGYYLGLAKFNPGKAGFYKLNALFWPTVFHGAYDFFLMQQNYPLIAVGAFISLIVALILANKAIVAHQGSSPFRFMFRGWRP